MPEINLMPWRATKDRYHKNRFFLLLALGLLFVFLVVILTHQFLNQRIQQQRSRNESLQQEIAVLDKNLARILKIKLGMKRLIGQVTMIHQCTQERRLLLQMLDALVTIIPQGVSLSLLKRQGDRVVLEGEALSNSHLSELMHHLEGLAFIQNPQISGIQKKTISPSWKANQFKLNFSLKFNG